MTLACPHPDQPPDQQRLQRNRRACREGTDEKASRGEPAIVSSDADGLLEGGLAVGNYSSNVLCRDSNRRPAAASPWIVVALTATGRAALALL